MRAGERSSALQTTPSESRYRAAIASSMIPLAFADLEGRVTEVNQALLDQLRCARADDVIGHSNAEFVVDHDQLRDVMGAALAGHGWRGEMRVRRSDGTEFTALLSVSLVVNADGSPDSLMASFIDVTEHRRVEDALYRNYRALRALASLRAILATSTTQLDMFAGVCRVMVDDAGYRMAWVGRVEHDKARTVRPLAAAGFEDGYLQRASISWGPGPLGAGPTGTAIRTKEPCVNQNVLTNPALAPWRAEAVQRGYASSVALPVLRGGDVFGALMLYASEPNAFDDQELSLLVEVAGDLSRGLDLIDARDARRRREAQQAAVARLGQYALETGALQPVLDEAVTLVATTLEVAMVKVLELQADDQRLLLRAGVGWHPGLVGRATVDTGLDSQAGYTLQRREPVLVENLRTETRFSGPRLLHDHDVVSGVSVVIGDRDHPYGVLGAHSRHPRTFSEDDGHFLQAVANVIAAAVQRVASKNALLEREAYFRALFENASDDLITVVTPSGQMLFQSPSSTQVLGLPADELVGQSIFSLIHEDDAARVREALARAATSVTASTTTEYRIRHGDGSWRFFESIGRSTSDAILSGAVVVNSRDVTERRLAEEALREREAIMARQARVLEETQRAARMGGFEADMRTRQLYFTDEMYRLFETSPEEFSPTTEAVIERFTQESRQLIRSTIAMLPAGGGAFDLDAEIRTFQNRLLRVRLVGLVQRDGGQPLRVFGALQDVTAHRQLEERVRQSQKMEAIGQLSGGVAHDFNNLLTAISGNAEIVREEARTQPAVLEAIGEIDDAIDRASSLTRQLLMFSRRQTMQLKNIDLREEVERLTRMLRRIIGEDVHLQLAFTPEPLPAQADPGMIDQVLINLAVNARDAMPDGGRLTIETARVEVTPEEEPAQPGRVGSFARITVSDTGHGIPADVMPHIFEPFFTTKDVGKGTGLGLATVYGIVQQHRGWITVESGAPSAGATFRVHLPLAPQAERPLSGPPAAEVLRGGAETVLLVEDEEAVRTLERRVLSRLGYRVLEAPSGPAAIAIWQARAADIDLLVTDLVMPDGISGVQLARRFQAENPRLRVLFASGYSAEPAPASPSGSETVRFIAKPFDLTAFGRAVRETLDAPPARTGH